ncbi:hypothetical protein ACFLIM_25165 [Nonomuraea sp. M3C6]|uniref:Uncharacterized protein n=1 Tax=Nonomuraea marmarensis TaxID=3351344 RepID=A0ABW7AGL2_9ACTN
MTHSNAPALVPFDADRATLTAYLDEYPAWQRLNIPNGRPYLKWRIRPDVAVERYGFHPMATAITLPKNDGYWADDEQLCITAAYTINSVELRAPDESSILIERLAAIYQLADPGGPIALLASGQVEPE